MKIIQTLILIVSVGMSLLAQQNAQDNSFWKLNSSSTLKKASYWNQISAFEGFELQFEAFRKHLIENAPFENLQGKALNIQLPFENGNLRTFAISEAPVMEEELAKKYPQIKTYMGTDGLNYLRMIVTNQWMKAYIFKENEDLILEPLSTDNPNHYGLYHASDITVDPHSLNSRCGETGGSILSKEIKSLTGDQLQTETTAQQFAGAVPVVLHTYRIALACTGEWGEDPSRGGGTKETALAKMADALTYATGVYEKDFAIRLKLTGRNDLLIWLNPNTDPYENANVGGALLGQNTGVVNPIITPGFYEFGHVFTNSCSDVGGIASLGSVCSQNRAAGVTCWYTQDVPYVALRIFCHEMGHQFSANHTFSNCNGNESNSRYEPGGGTTIMSYSGLCGSLDIESGAPPHPNFFHAHSLEEVNIFTRQFLTCGEKTATANSYPTAQIQTPAGLFIPIQTPFELKGKGFDMEDTTLTYSWEQYDNGDYGDRVGDVRPNGPLFRVLFPSTNPNRVFPNWNSIINLKNNDPKEVLPSVSRDINFRFVVRDNHPGSGGSSWESLKLKVTDQAGPFSVTFPNLATHRLIKNTCNKISWNVARTNELPVNCKKVDILLIRNRDFNNPVVLLENTENDGSELVDIPDLGNNIRVRIVVKARDHIFLDASDADAVIVQGTTPSVTMGITPNLATLCLPDELSVDVKTCSFGGFTGDLQLFLESGLPSGASYQFEKNTIGAADQTKLKIDLKNLKDKTDVQLVVAAITPAGDTLRDEVRIQVISNDFTDQQLVGPIASARAIKESPLFRWKKSRNADYYHFDLASSPAFGASTVYNQNYLSTDSLRLPILLKANTIYYWRVIPVNACGDGAATETYAFQTENKTCVDQPYSGNPEGLFSGRSKSVIVPIPFSGQLSEINVNDVEIIADAVRDVNINLVSPKGSRVVLFNYNCANTLDFDCSFDDDASVPLSCPPNRGTRMKPFEPLSKLIGEDVKGDWKLEVNTKSTFRDGEIRNFTLQYCADLQVSPPQLIHNGPLITDIGASKNITQTLLESTDPDDGPANLIYTLVSTTGQGSLKLNGKVLDYGNTFSQKDINDGLLNYTHNGSANYYDGFSYTVNDGKGGWLGIEVFRILVGPVGTKDDKMDEMLKSYPNPSTGFLVIEREGPLVTEEAVIELKNLNGVVCLSKKIKWEKNISLDLQHLTDGMYLLEYRSGLNRISRKLMLLKF